MVVPPSKYAEKTLLAVPVQNKGRSAVSSYFLYAFEYIGSESACAAVHVQIYRNYHGSKPRIVIGGTVFPATRFSFSGARCKGLADFDNRWLCSCHWPYG